MAWAVAATACAAEADDGPYRPQADVEADPPAFYSPKLYEEIGLAKDSGGYTEEEGKRFVQPLLQYVASNPPRLTRRRHTFYVLPVGPTNEVFWRHLRSIRVFLETYLTLPVELLPAVELGNPPSRLRPNSKDEVRQYESHFLLKNVVMPCRPDDAFSVLGLTLEDIYSEHRDWPGWGGTWQSKPPAAMYTLWPFPESVHPSDPDYLQGLARSLRIAAMEAVHTFGIDPCRRYRCLLNQGPLGAGPCIHLCPECLKKLRWNVGFDLVERYAALRRFYAQMGMKDEAAWVTKRIQECRQALPAPTMQAAPAPALPRQIDDDADPLLNPQADITRDPPAYYSEALFHKMGAPQPGDWMAAHPEPPQSFSDYVSSGPNRPRRVRKWIILQPLGTITPETRDRMKTLRAFLAAYYALPVQTGEWIPLANAKSREHNFYGHTSRQYLTSDILQNRLLPRVRTGTFAMLGVTTGDLYPEESWNYVLGHAWLAHRVGVYSLARFYPEFWGDERTDEADRLGLVRSLKTLVHETGHLFGIHHCQTYKCVMNGFNNLAELDNRPIHLCPECLKKFRWNVGFNIISRYEALRRFYIGIGLKEEAAWLTNRLRECRQAPPAPTKQAAPAPAPEEKEKTETPDTP
jgi:archaemetzincin